MGWYMASISKVDPKYNETMGLMHSLAQGKSNEWNKHRIEAGVPWALDNGVFANKFSLSVWLKRLEGLEVYSKTCSFIVIPDVVGKARETIDSFHKYRDMVSGFPVAFVSQDGIRNYESEIPWDKFDYVFIGGSNEHKLGSEGRWVIDEAKKRDKKLHVGRVNSQKRMFEFWMADSWDGTCLGFDPPRIEKFHKAILKIRQMKKERNIS